MKKYISFIMLLFTVCTAQAQRSDIELNRDSVTGWQYVSNPPNPKTIYKPVNSGGETFSVWQQQAVANLYNWIQQSYLPRGLVMRTVIKNYKDWYTDESGPLHFYGLVNLGYPAHFVNGKINLHCCEQGDKLVIGVNQFPGAYIRGFNPGGLHFFAEQAPFTGGDNDAQLAKEGIDKKIQPNLYNHRTYLDHYHNNGKQVFKIGVVVAKNGQWPFKPVSVKDAVAFIQQQMAAWPGIMQKNPYSVKEVQDAMERLKPYYNEIAKLKANLNFYNSLNDGNGHYLLDPRDMLNSKSSINKPLPEYSVLVATTQQTIDQTKTDNPLWVYFNLTPTTVFMEENPAKFDTKYGTAEAHMVYSMLHNFNYDYVAKWLAQPDAMKNIVYAPVHAPSKSSGDNITAPIKVSQAVATKNKDPYTILFEDFEGYQPGGFAAKGWHTYGHDGHDFANGTLNTLNRQAGKWISLPDAFTFYPDFAKPLPASFTVNYDVYFSSDMPNKRSAVTFRLDTYDNKKSNPIDLHDINRNGFQFSMAPSGEAQTSKRFMELKFNETLKDLRLTNIKTNEVIHVSVIVNGAAVTVTVNGAAVMHDDNVLPAGKTFKRYGWYADNEKMYLSNIYVKGGTPVQSANPPEPQFAGVVKEPKQNTATPDAFEPTPYVPVTLPKLDALPAINYPAGFKSAMPAIQTSSGKAVAGLKPDYKFPQKSAALGSISNTVVSADGFKKLISDIQILSVKKLQQANASKLDTYLKSKKINSSRAINTTAINTWLEGKPTVALYLFCKALQADYTDMLTANNLSSLLISYGYAEKAIPVLLYVNKQTNGAPDALANLAGASYNLGDANAALSFAEKSIVKDSLNANANKVAAFAHLNKAAQTGDKTETEKAISCLKQSLKSGYNKEASDILGKIESNHNKNEDFVNTNFKEFPMLKRLQMPAMPEDLHQMISFNQQLDLEKSAINKAKDEVTAAYTKLPNPDVERMKAAAMQNSGIAFIMGKAATITNQTGVWYMKMKKDLEDIFVMNKNELTKKHSEKIKAITKKYAPRLNKLEGGEGKSDEDEERENLLKQECDEYNKESAMYLSAIAKLTNQFAQRSEYVSRVYCRDLANWNPVQLNDNSGKSFMAAQRIYLIDIYKIISFYTAIEPCTYRAEVRSKNNTQARPKQWEDAYCANVKGTIGLGAAKVSFNCSSWTVSGGEGLVGELTANYNEDGSFKDVTVGAGVGAEWNFGKKEIAGGSVGATAMEYLTVGQGADGKIGVKDFGISAGASVSGSVYNGTAGEEINIASMQVSFVTSEMSIGGAVPDALRLL